ncbi:MAG: MFS transporter, partial [Deltaproteobacteria bacterium]|nr:MFS transporter [Deltaproteobacteria bacterium]
MAYLIIRTMSNWRGIRNRVPLVNFYLFTILSSFILYRGIFMLFLSGKGLTLAEVGLYQTFFFLANTALEIPTGYIGDRFGRKASIVSGLVILCIYSLLITLTLPVMLVVGLAVIEALAYSLISGSDSALLYDNVKELYGEKSFDRINSQIHSTRAIAVGFGIVAGSLISTASWNLLYYLSAAINLSSAFVALGIRDAHSVTRQKRLPIKLSDFGSYITHKNPTGFILSILGIALADGLFIVIFNYNQLTLKHSSVSTPIIGVIFATIYFLNPISYMVAGRLSSQTNKVRLIIWGLLIQACALSLFTLVQSWLLIGVVLLSSLVPEYIFINYENYVQQNIRSELRATLMSTVSMLRSVSAAFLYLVIGVVMDKADGRLVTSYCGAALFISVLIVVSILRWKNRNTRRAVQRISIDEIPLGEYSDDYISRIITQQLEDTLVPPQNGQPPSDRLSVVLADDGIVIQKGVSSLDETDLEYVFTQLVGRLQDKKYPRNI